MQTTSLVLTAIAEDRPGLVETLASIVARHDGNWIESSMSRLAGAFAGIVRVEVPVGRSEELEAALGALAGEGIAVTVKQADAASENHGQAAHVSLMCQDHPGILHALATLFAARRVSITELETEAYAGSMSGERMFRAEVDVVLPIDLAASDLSQELERLAGDMMAEISFADVT
ncbi:MAG: amino acid-binding protein [Stappia sp.]|uniref:glycine cleavage system protein R n=1 Tax=Stappia sp. TaxID=1870903 RepID=UPI000C4C104B|nr:ACT domain-containing protein [Stappia sp.]MAB01139.1 amino acid-binding protein [Stappia sp.]MBM19857.1 amino acid-binding protein [Stappia sp.]